MHTMAMLMLRRVGMYWHVFPTFEQGRKAIWEGFRKDGKRTDRNRDSASAPCPINAVAGSNVLDVEDRVIVGQPGFMQRVAELGLNLIRLPVWYRTLETDYVGANKEELMAGAGAAVILLILLLRPRLFKRRGGEDTAAALVRLHTTVREGSRYFRVAWDKEA